MGIGASFWWRDTLPRTNQLGFGKRRWNMETSSLSSAVVEFPPPYLNIRNIMMFSNLMVVMIDDDDE